MMTEEKSRLKAEEELIIDIRRRFRYPIKDIKKGLQSYELDLIYLAYPDISKKFIDSAIRSLRYEKFSGKLPRTPQKSRAEEIGRGVSFGSIHL